MFVFQLQCSYRDADEFHTEANKKKMNNGIPLTDQVRMDYLLSPFCCFELTGPIKYSLKS